MMQAATPVASKTRSKCLFSYYGAKSKLVRHYPPPQHDLIIEPFAGAANYALRFHERHVLLNELNPRTWNIWNYLLRTSIERVLAEIPLTVVKGQQVSDLVAKDADPGLVEIMRANCNMGSAGAQVSETVTWFAERKWPNVHQRLTHFLPKIAHWVLLPRGDYSQVQWHDATWFIDPPYQQIGKAKPYTFHDIDYEVLARWCRSRRGQVIVCENDGAQWLPFEPLTSAQSRGNTAPSHEAVWTRSG